MNPEFYLLMSILWDFFKKKKSVLDTAIEIQAMNIFNYSDVVCYPTVQHWFEEFRICPDYYETHIPNQSVHQDLVMAFLKKLVENNPSWPIRYIADALRERQKKTVEYLKNLDVFV